MEQIYVIQTSPNQKIVKTRKAEQGSNQPFSVCNVHTMLAAAQKLSDRAFKLYVCMNLHPDGHTYPLSPNKITNATGMSIKRYREAVKELVSKGFLAKCKDSKTQYTFFEDPKLD